MTGSLPVLSVLLGVKPSGSSLRRKEDKPRRRFFNSIFLFSVLAARMDNLEFSITRIDLAWRP